MAVISIPTSVAGVSLPGQLGQIAKGPLAALYGGKGVQTLKYPSDLATDATKNHYVQFSIKEVIPAGYSTTSSTNLFLFCHILNLVMVHSFNQKETV